MKQAQDLVAQAKQKITEVDLANVAVALEQAELLIDVREPAEFAAGHIAGAVNIPRGMLEFKLSASPELAKPDLNIVVYCKTSGRSALSAVSLQEMGYTQVTSFAGGFDAWLAAGHPVQA